MSNNKMRSQSLDQMDPGGSGSKVLESMTIHKQYLEYHELKAQVFLLVAKVNRCSVVLSVFGVIFFSVLLVFIFSGLHDVPVSCEIGFYIAYDTAASNVDYPAVVAVFSELFGVVCTSCFMILGGYIMYYKALVKVETMQKINNMAFRMTIVFCVLAFLHSGLAVMCSIFVKQLE